MGKHVTRPGRMALRRVWLRAGRSAALVVLSLSAAVLPRFASADTQAPQGRPVVGAIRWDAWHGTASDVGITVERTLAPKHWHYRLPFYARVADDGSVEARGNTREIMDREIAFAKAAGLDYWAFVVYPEEHALSLGLKLYLASTHSADIRFCLNLQGGWEGRGGTAAWRDKVARYVSCFKRPNYQTVLDCRPLVYLYSVDDLVGNNGFETWEAARAAFDQLRSAAKQAGTGNPYIVAQGWSPEKLKQQAQMLGLDALGAYASNGGGRAAPYAALAAHTEQWWDAFCATGCEVVPLASAGWDMRPRVETPVPWVRNGDLGQYYEAPKPPELAAHLGRAVQWCRNHPEAARAQAVLLYAWNEFDEGGWLCPTLSEGSARLDAVRTVLRPESAPVK